MKLIMNGVVVGLAIFSSYFGAGNLIFPPKLGIEAGSMFASPLLGYIIAGIFLPVLALLAYTKVGGSVELFAKNLGKTGSVILATATYLIIGPLFAIPRTAATSYEFSKAALFPDVSSDVVAIAFSVLFFAAVLYFVLSQDTVIDKLGKILTPILLACLIVIIVKGLISDATPVDTNYEGGFVTGFFSGYQTMDALASMLFGSMLISFLQIHNITDKKDKRTVTGIAVIITTVCLTFVYGGLCVIGAKYSGIVPGNLSLVESLSALIQVMLGRNGQYILMVCVMFACLTTAIGLTTCISDYFSKLSGGKFTYKQLALMISLVSCLFSIMGVDAIVKVAGPVLALIYPIVIILVITNLLSDFIPNLKGCQLGALAVGEFIVIIALAAEQTATKVEFISKLPLASNGVAWLVPAVVGAIIGIIFIRDKKEA